MSSDTGYQLVLNGNGAFEASVGAGGTFGAPVVVNAGATTKNGPLYVAMTYDGTNLSLYVNPAASGGPSTLGSDMFHQATVTYTPATSGELRMGASAAVGHRVSSSPGRSRTSRYTTGHSASTRSSTTTRPVCAGLRPTPADPQ